MAIYKDIGANRIAYPDRLGETINLYMHISKKDELFINGVKITLPDECFNLTYVKKGEPDKLY